MSRPLPIVAASLLALLAGCAETTSEDIATSRMWVDLSASASDDSTVEASAIFRTGGALSNSYITMSGNDYLDATHDVTTRRMEKHSRLGIISYETTFSDLAQSSGELLTITFHREDETVENDLLLPATFHIDAPSANTSYRIITNDTITVAWTPFNSGDEMMVTYRYTCNDGGRYFNGSVSHQHLADGGIDSASVREVLAAIGELSLLDHCGVTIIVERQREQALADAYKGGTAMGVQRREVYVSFVP